MPSLFWVEAISPTARASPAAIIFVSEKACYSLSAYSKAFFAIFAAWAYYSKYIHRIRSHDLYSKLFKFWSKAALSSIQPTRFMPSVAIFKTRRHLNASAKSRVSILTRHCFPAFAQT